MEQRRNACGGGDRVSELEVRLVGLEQGVVGPPVALVPIDLATGVLARILLGRLPGHLPLRTVGLAHADGLEAPVVAGVQGGRVDQEDGNRRVAARVALDGTEVRTLPGGGDKKLPHLDHGVARPVPRGAVERLVVQLAEPVAAGVVRLRHAEVLAEVAERAAAQVRLHAEPEGLSDALDDVRVVVVGDIGVRRLLEKGAHVDVVEGADDRAARDGRDHLDPAEDPQLGHAREHSDVEEGSAKAAARERQAEPLRRAPARLRGHCATLSRNGVPAVTSERDLLSVWSSFGTNARVLQAARRCDKKRRRGSHEQPAGEMDLHRARRRRLVGVDAQTVSRGVRRALRAAA
jgi:hypothetical protein